MQSDAHFDSLKQILENMRFLDRLDAHPWVESLTVREHAASDPALRRKTPGAQLALTLGKLFEQMMPATPPQDGKRLDTRWGRFGILAANYFAPLLYGRIYPHTLREAWRRIDQAVLLFVYGKTADQLTPEQIRTYRLIGDEADFAANSTISDWHRSGVQDLMNLFLDQEKHLSLSLGMPSVLLDGKRNGGLRRTPAASPNHWWARWRQTRAFIAAACALIMIVIAVQGLRVYSLIQSVKTDVRQLDELNLTSLDPAALERTGPILDKASQDVHALRAIASPWLWLGPGLGWVPAYGGDLYYAGELLDVAAGLTDSASLTYQTAFPIWQSFHQDQGAFKASALTGKLLDSQAALLQAQIVLQQGAEARRRVIPERLSPGAQSWLRRADTYSTSLDQGLSMALSLPRLLGAGSEGPKTYLILIQNEDELRPTGGFITAVGKVVVWNGELIGWDIADSYSVDDVNKAYPPAPWQLQSFMNIPITTFRDANWSPDFPTTVMWAEYLYAYTNSYSVNGVIAIDQHVLKTLLSVTGPVYVDDISTTVNADNIEQVMRAQKIPPPAELRDPNWYRKRFMNPIAATVLEKMLSGNGLSWENLLRAAIGDLDQRHILVELDDPVAARLLSERDWNGALARKPGDYLMLVDANVGYNKTNAVVSSQLYYDVDLQDITAPASNLQVFHNNEARGADGVCDQRPGGIDQSTLEFWYPIDRCYYDYLRVYVPAGTQLKSATPQAVTRDQMIMLGQDVPAGVDRLDENLQGLQAFGTLLVVPMGQTLETDFQFNLPVGILESDPVTGGKIYRLKVQKQPGTESIPVTVRVHLPQSARITSVTPDEPLQAGDNLLFDLKLTVDANILIRFQP